MAYQLDEKLYKKTKEICLNHYHEGKNPIQLLTDVWDHSDFPMHCPEHHFLVPAVLLTVYHKLKGEDRTVLKKDLETAEERAKNILAGFCGWYGACGAAVGSGIFFALLTNSTPYSTKTWAQANRLTADCLRDIASTGGPRCCKRVCFTTIITTVTFMKEHMNLDAGELLNVTCRYYDRNAECKKALCPFYDG